MVGIVRSKELVARAELISGYIQLPSGKMNELINSTPSGLMQHALRLASLTQAVTTPNPTVGCLLLDSGGALLGQGHTQRAGGAHAEIMALQDATSKDHSVRGATAYVTLEPCAHHGRTGPCCDALIAAGIKKVDASITDPNPLVAGQGFARLRAAGIEVEIGLGAAESRELNIGFFSRMIRITPWVRLKIAASLDGTTALANGKSQWITSQEARADGHAWRARSCAVLTGIGTLLQDDPGLDVRLVETTRQPHRVIVDSLLQTPLDARIFNAEGQVWIYTASEDAGKTQALRDRGATVSHLANDSGKVDLTAMMFDLARREVNELHVEAGHKLNGSLIRAGLVDEFLVYLAPKLIGQGCDMASFGPLSDLSQAIKLEFKSTEMLGPDLRLVARISGREQF